MSDSTPYFNSMLTLYVVAAFAIAALHACFHTVFIGYKEDFLECFALMSIIWVPGLIVLYTVIFFLPS